MKQSKLVRNKQCLTKKLQYRSFELKFNMIFNVPDTEP